MIFCYNIFSYIVKIYKNKQIGELDINIGICYYNQLITKNQYPIEKNTAKYVLNIIAYKKLYLYIHCQFNIFYLKFKIF